MTISCAKRLAVEIGGAARRAIGAGAGRHAAGSAARQGRAGWFEGRRVAPTPTRVAQKVTLRTPTHNYRGKYSVTGWRSGWSSADAAKAQVPDIAGEFGKWNRGTGAVPLRRWRKCLILQRNSESGTVEPWNRKTPIHARAHAFTRNGWFHGSMVPEGRIDRGYQSLSVISAWNRAGSTVPLSEFANDLNRKGVI